MVTEPTYLKNLKSYARSRYGDEVDIEESLADFSNESDRGALILSATAVEDSLEYMIISRLPALLADENARKEMFERDGPIATFSRKIAMAYAMGIIDKPARRQIDLIREIRNACAHSRKPISLDRPELQAAIRGAISEMLPALINETPATLRTAFIVKTGLLSHYIVTGEKLETPDDHIRHAEKLAEGYRPSPDTHR